MALVATQSVPVQAAVPPPSEAPSSSPEILPSQPDGPRPAPVVDLAIPPDAASGGSAMDPSIEARPLIEPVDAPGAPTEVEAARTERTRLTANPNGTFTLEQSTGRIHYQTVQGDWAPINLSLLPTAGSFDLRVAANDRDLRLATSSADGAVAELAADGRTILLKLGEPVEGERSTDTRHGVDRLAYPLGEQRPTIYVQPTTDGLTYGATLADAQTESVVDVVLQLDGYRARVAGDGATIELIAPTGQGEPVLEPTPIPSATPSPTPTATPDPSPSEGPPASPGSSSSASPAPSPSPSPDPSPSTSPIPSASPSPDVSPPPPTDSPPPSASPSPSGSPTPTPSPSARAIGIISPPVILEGPDRLLTSAPLTVEVLPGQAPDEVRVRYLLDPAWLAAPERQFPVELDPSICVQAGGSGCSSANDVINTYIGSGQPNTYPNPPSVLRAGDDALPDVAWNTLRSLIWFEHQTLPDGAVVTGATLRLREDHNYDASLTPDIIARPISLEGWGTTATWSQLANAVRSGQDSPAVNPCSTGSTDCDVTLDVENAVRSWYTRRAKDWRTNNGVQVRLATEGSTLDEIDFYVSSGCTNTTCPKLTITYEVPQVGIDFDPLLGRVYAPSTMIAGRTTRLPVVVTNNGSAQDFTTSAYEVGYRWFDAKGNQGSLPKGTTSLPGCIGVGTNCDPSRGPFALPVNAPSAPGMYTLRLDLVRVDGSVDLCGRRTGPRRPSTSAATRSS
jgi:hypothetical protein